MIFLGLLLLVTVAVNNGGWAWYHQWKVKKLLKGHDDNDIYPDMQKMIDSMYPTTDNVFDLVPIDDMEKALINKEQGLVTLPKHIGIIPDGNRRWAKALSLPSSAGHTAGRDAVVNTIRTAYMIGIEYLTFYAFSSENFKRDNKETQAIYETVRDLLIEAQSMREKSTYGPLFRLQVVGDLNNNLLPDYLKELFLEVNEELDHDNYELTITFFFAYNGRESIARSCNEAANDIYVNKDMITDNNTVITEEIIQNHMETNFLPPVDLIIRTSGEQRLSGFMTWESVYSEFIFEQSYWPAYDANIFTKNLREYQRRERRFGGSSK